MRLPVLYAILLCMLLMPACAQQPVFTSINHIVHNGQSLAGGEQSLPLVTDADTHSGNLSFAMGTSTWTYNVFPDQPWLRASSDFTFVPLTARQRGGEGETIANGLCDHLKSSLQNSRYKQSRFLFSYTGQGGRYLRELDKRHDDAKDPRAGARRSKGGHYMTSIDDVRRAKQLCDSLGISYSVTAVTWMQGERGNDLKVNRWDSVLSYPDFLTIYKQDLINLKNDYQQDIIAITHQRSKPPFFTYQTGGGISGTAQLMACDQEKDMFLVSPTYMLPSAVNGHYRQAGRQVHGAAIHLTADGERMLGELFGKVIRKVVLEKERWQPLRPLQASYNKNEKSISIQFHVPQPPVVIDSFFLPKQGRGAGFEVYDNTNHVYTVSGVQVEGNDRIKILLAAPLPVNTPVFVRYGLSSYVMDIDPPVQTVSPKEKNSDTIKITFNGNIVQRFAVLLKEGAFYLCNRSATGAGHSKLLVRAVYADGNGNTILEAEPETPGEAMTLEAGQQCYVSRIYGYGNMHDSDREQAVFTFQDAGYGARAGESYPLYNWCVVFKDLSVQFK